MKLFKKIFGLFLSIVLLSQQGHAFNIIEDSSILDNHGYSNDNMQTNGELLIIKNFIKNGNIIFDIGANSGEWGKTVFKNHPNVFIHAFEPIPHLYESLKTIDKDHYYPHNSALSDNNGTSNFFYYPNLDVLSSLYNRPVMKLFADCPCVNLKITTETLDHFCENNAISHIHFVKIDTEGNELKVLLGASNLLKKHAIDCIQFEYGGTYPDASITLKEVCFFIASMGYKIYRITPDSLIHIAQWRESLENNKYSNYLAFSPNIHI